MKRAPFSGSNPPGKAGYISSPYLYYTIVELLAETGLRVSELLRLSVGDIEIGERFGKATVRKGKHSGFREIPLTRDLRYTLNAYLEEHPRREDADAPLWMGIRGELKHRSSIFRILSKYTKIAGLAGIGSHTLRHTFAYQYLQANPDDIRGLAALLGHSNINTVMFSMLLNIWFHYWSPL
jgi:integrase